MKQNLFVVYLLMTKEQFYLACYTVVLDFKSSYAKMPTSTKECDILKMSTTIPQNEQLISTANTFDTELFMIGLKIVIGLIGIIGNAMVCMVLQKLSRRK